MAKTVYEFAIKKDVLQSGKIILTPVCRRKSLFGIFPNPWDRIIIIYGEYLVMNLDFIPELTFAECEEHIQGYQKVLEEQVENDIATVEFHELEEVKI